MARPREFDPDELLIKAVRMFWKKGYADTSMRDIVEATRVAHAGLYSAFGNKRDLYFKCLQRYYQRFGDIAIKQLEAEDSDITSVHRFFEVISQGIEGGRFQTGCLIGNTVVEFGSDADDVIGFSRKFIERLSQAFSVALEHAKAKQQIGSEEDTAALSEFLTTFFYGQMTMVRAGISIEKIRSGTACVLAKLV